jgi:integrase
MRKTLTDAKVRGAKPGPKPFKLADGGGLFLHVHPSGSRLWRWRYWLGGKEQTFAVGSYPDLGLADARRAVDAARALVERGINPAHARQEEKRANLETIEARRRDEADVFSRVAEEWFAAGKWAENTRDGKRRRLDKQILPALGSLPVGKIGPGEVRPLLANCAEWTAVYVKGDLDAIFRFALVRGFCETNPIPGLRGLVRVPASENKAALTFPQIRAFFANIRAHRGYPETLACFRFLALTAARPGEACAAEWSEIDAGEKLWRLSAEKMKGRRAHVSPLSREALAVLEELRVITGAGRYLFPSRDGVGCASTTRLSVVMKGMNLAARASPHCWRTTFSTWANERGFRPDAIERQLAHVESNKVRGAYNKALLVEERREMMQAWADYLSSAEAENVIPLPVSR